MYHVDKLNRGVRMYIDRIALPVELRELIAQYTNSHIDDYERIQSMGCNRLDTSWSDDSGRSRWSQIALDCRNILSRGVVIIQHDHHQMSIIKLAQKSVEIKFDIICEAISTCDYSTIENLIFQDDKTLSDSGLSPRWIKFVTMDSVKLCVRNFI